MLPRLALTCALAVLVSARLAFPQTTPPPDAPPSASAEAQQYEAPAYVSVVDGSATLERDGRVESAPLNMPLLSGDRLKTIDGRVEVRFADGGRLHLDAQTAVDVLSDELVRLAEGRLRISVQRAPRVSYRIDSTAGSVRITQAGEYRVALIHGAQETQLELAVIRGNADIFTDQGTTTVRSGERAYASAGLLPSYAYTYNSATMDEFDRWSDMQRGTVYTASSDSSQYLPADMTGYASTFDQYGDWRYQQTYGYVWYPRVAPGWRPYYYGRWASYPTYGWTWIAGDAFGYPTHHYGRWGVSAGVWYWIPRPYWGPAYVSWGYAPSYVSWCPLGWNNYAVFSIGYYNVGPSYYAGHYRGHYQAAWTTVPRSHFGHGYYAHQNAVNWDRPGYTGARASFTEGRVGPGTGDVAVPRNSTPVRFAGTRTVTAPAGVASGSNAAGVPPSRIAGADRRADWRSPDGARSTQGETPRYVGRGDDIARSQAARQGPPTDRAVDRTGDTPRYINRGEQIVRSQNGRAVAPADSAIPRTAPPVFSSPSMPARRTDAPPAMGEGRAADHPAYRPSPSTTDPSVYAPTYDRAAPRWQGQPAPRTDDRPAAGDPRGYNQPSMGDRAYDRPSPGDRAYSRPNGGDTASPRPSAGDRPSDRPVAPRGETPRPTERVAPAAPGAGAPAHPPAAAPRSGGGGGGDRAAPRAGGRGGR